MVFTPMDSVSEKLDFTSISKEMSTLFTSRELIGMMVSRRRLNKSENSLSLFRLFIQLPGSLLLQLFQPGTGFGYNETALRSQRNARMTLGTFKSFSFQEQGQIEIDNIPAVRTWDRIGHIVIFFKVWFRFRHNFKKIDTQKEQKCFDWPA